MKYFIGIDVGTGSARAGVFSAEGQLLGAASHTLALNKPAHDFVEQSSSQIWDACCISTKSAVAKAGVDPAVIAGIGFDATCSLVLLDDADAPLAATPEQADAWNVIVWMDHRAIAEATEINMQDADVLKRVGGRISPEMEIPKLLWLKRHNPDTWQKAARMFDLPDWLVHRATGTNDRSMCSPVCKWTYLGEKGGDGNGWDADFLARIGLSDLTENGFVRIGNVMLSPGSRAGSLTEQAAQELGLMPGISVAVGAIDAYAGALGTLGLGAKTKTDMLSRMALVGGTSTCHLTVSEQALFVPGVWGPYFDVLLPGVWTNEAGQSASGVLIDRLLQGDANYADLREEAAAKSTTVYDVLNAHLDALAGDHPVHTLSRDVHMVPDFHGNRSPLADPLRKGSVVGLTLDRGRDALALTYLAAIQGLAYGTRHIMEVFAGQGAQFKTIVMSGGLARNPLYRQTHADVTGCTVLAAEHSEAVLLGSAMMGASASGAYADLLAAMAAMSGSFAETSPQDRSEYHDSKYKIFRKMQDDFASYAAIMGEQE